MESRAENRMKDNRSHDLPRIYEVSGIDTEESSSSSASSFIEVDSNSNIIACILILLLVESSCDQSRCIKDLHCSTSMWEKLKASNRSRDAVFISNIRTNFTSQLFDPTKQSMRQFINILEHYRTQILATDAPITDIEL